MAELPEHNPMRDVYFFISIVVIIVILWYASGGPGHADLSGIFLRAPQPYGQGGSAQSQAPAAQFQNGSVAAPTSFGAPNSGASAACAYTSNAAHVAVAIPFSYTGNAQTDQNTCINQCKMVRNSAYGPGDSGTCLFTAQNGLQTSALIQAYN